MKFHTFTSQGIVLEVKEEVYRKAVEHENALNLIGMFQYPGIMQLFNSIEQTFFPINTKANEDYVIHTIEWLNALFSVVTLPLNSKSIIESFTQKNGFYFSDGIPAIIMKGKIHYFPINNINSYHIKILHENSK